jgi:hypothetical protein
VAKALQRRRQLGGCREDCDLRLQFDCGVGEIVAPEWLVGRRGGKRRKGGERGKDADAKRQAHG